VRDDKALLLTKDIIELRPYNPDYVAVTLEKCTLRQYLNGWVLQTFNSAEQSRILQTHNINANNQWYGTEGGNDTVDRIFLLSPEETVKYFGDSGQLKYRPTGNPNHISDQYNNVRINTPGWWLRSPGFHDDYAAYVSGARCVISLCGSGVAYSEGVRPALWIIM
jgi:hypothetical protein